MLIGENYKCTARLQLVRGEMGNKITVIYGNSNNYKRLHLQLRLYGEDTSSDH